MPAIGHGDRSDHNPQHGGPYEVIGHESHPCRQRHEDSVASYETHVHEHLHEQTLSTVVNPHHKHPVGWQPSEEEYRQDVRQREGSGGDAASPEERREVPRSPQHAHDKPCSKDTVTQPHPGYGEPRPP